MLSDVTKLRPWHFAVGGTFLIVISLHDAVRVVGERWDRAEVLSHGREVQARVIRTAGPDSVQIEWTDEGGKSQTAESRTGKVFARSSAGSTVQIKYDPALRREPVILAEVEERERLEAYTLRWSLIVIAGLAAVAGAAAYSMRRARRIRTNSASQ